LGIKKPENNVFKSLLLILSPEVIPYAQNLSNLLFGGQYSNILHICKTFIVTERESSLMNVTKSSIDKSFGSNSPAMIQHFSKFENLKICSERIIAITQDLPVEVIETVSVHDLNLVLLPWLQAEEDREGHLPQVIRYLLGGCPATIALYVPCRSLSVSGSSGKILVPFFGGDNDIEALLMGVYFSQTAWVVICRYYSSDSSNDLSDETDFLSTTDKLALDFVKEIMKENTNIEYTKKKCKSSSHILEVLAQDLGLYSLVVAGRNSLDYFPESTTERSSILGNVAHFIEELKIVNLIVLNRSKRRPKYPFMPPADKNEGEEVSVKEL
jgi:hypothetical protein